jgi:hypothetical protein
MFQTRARMVSFRLSEDEYERLKDLSMSERARSVSDFARSVLCKLPAASGKEFQDMADSRLDRLEGVVQHLRLELRQVRHLVETLNGGSDVGSSHNGQSSLDENGSL